VTGPLSHAGSDGVFSMDFIEQRSRGVQRLPNARLFPNGCFYLWERFVGAVR
jgi:hypothetical protein